MAFSRHSFVLGADLTRILLPAQTWQRGANAQVACFGSMLWRNRERLGLAMSNEQKESRSWRQDHTGEEHDVIARIREAAKSWNWEEANSAFRTLPEPSAFSYFAMLHATCRCGKLQQAEEVFSEMKSSRIATTLGAYTSLINLNSRRGLLDRTAELLLEMQADGIEADVMVYSAMLNGHAKSGNIDAATKVWEQMLAADVKPTAVAYVSLLNVLAKAGRPDLALKHLEEMASHGLMPLTTHWNVVLKACQWKLDGAAAQNELRRMVQSGVLPNIISYTAVLAAIVRERAPNWQAEAEALAVSMSEASIAADEHFVEVLAAAHLGHESTTAAMRGGFDDVPLEGLQAAAKLFQEAQCKQLEFSDRLKRIEQAVSEAINRKEPATKTTQWVEVKNTEHGTYYWDQSTGVTQWERPAGI